jgi:hypothetical protein
MVRQLVELHVHCPLQPILTAFQPLSEHTARSRPAPSLGDIHSITRALLDCEVLNWYEVNAV